MISTETVLHKMQKELDSAMKNVDDRQVMLKHIENIQLLTELFIEHKTDEESKEKTPTTSTITSDQMDKQSSATKIIEKDGTSIFDF